MRIGIDARELAGKVTGVGRFLEGLLRTWAASVPALPHEFVLYAPAPLGVPLDPVQFRVRVVPGSGGTWWEQRHLPRAARADGLDVFFAPAYTAPLQIGVPIVAAIYDLSYLAHPEWFRLREGVRRRWLTAQTAARAQTIITLSEFSRREIVDRLGVAPRQVRVVLPGIDRDEIASTPGPDARILFVGSIFNRRHVPDLIRAVASLARRRSSVSLDIVGDNRTFPHQDVEGIIAREGLEGRIRWHRYVTGERLLELYASARAFAFLSEYEGLGLTPLEALAAGIPPVLYDTAVARESCGHAAFFVPVGDRTATELTLERALFDEAARAHVLASRPVVLARYDWLRAARDTLALLETARSW